MLNYICTTIYIIDIVELCQYSHNLIWFWFDLGKQVIWFEFLWPIEKIHSDLIWLSVKWFNLWFDPSWFCPSLAGIITCSLAILQSSHYSKYLDATIYTGLLATCASLHDLQNLSPYINLFHQAQSEPNLQRFYNILICNSYQSLWEWHESDTVRAEICKSTREKWGDVKKCLFELWLFFAIGMFHISAHFIMQWF